MVTPEFLITSFLIILIPGTGVLYTVSTGIFLGLPASIAAAIGCTAGIIPHIIISILGLTAILHVSSVAFQIVKYTGALYLFYLAWKMWKETGSLSLNKQSKAGYCAIIFRAVTINLLNPKLSIFFLAFLPLFISPHTGSSTLQLICLSLVFMIMTLVVFIFYGLLAHVISNCIKSTPMLMKRIQKTIAVLFAAMGLKLALLAD
jgi:threonine/homoserine/homoserine lactone efflux protein